MKLNDDGEFTALSWVKHALDATLAQARESLETYVDQPDDLAPMRACVEHLHQVQGTLRMVELYGAAMVVENMEKLAEALVANTVRQRDEGYSVLMRGMVQLPDYLERLQSGHKDIPIVLLPLLNDLRAVRGENLLSESALFAPDLELPLPASAAGRATALPQAELHAQALRLRLAFQAALLKWFRDEAASEHLGRLTEVLDRLRSISHGVPARRLWWISAGVVDAVRCGDLDAGVSVKLLFGRVDREIHRFAQIGEARFTAEPPRETTKNLLYYVAQTAASGATPASARCAEIRATYRLDTLLPTESELQHAQGSMTGRNKSLLGTVSAAIKDDLVRVKEALDIFLRGGNGDPAELAAHAEVLDRVADTLGMLGLGVPRRLIEEQRVILDEMARRQRPMDEGALLDVAGALLYVEASLDDHIERLGAGDDDEETTDGTPRLPKAEVRKILDTLMREAVVNITRAKQDVVAFIESPWDHDRVVQIPQLLEEIAGALRMLGLANAGELMTAIVRFVEVELITYRRVPTAEQMDKLADALAAIEYYLEATRDQRSGRERILEVARDSLEGLGYWPLPEVSTSLPMPPARAAVADVVAPVVADDEVATLPVTETVAAPEEVPDDGSAEREIATSDEPLGLRAPDPEMPEPTAVVAASDAVSPDIAVEAATDRASVQEVEPEHDEGWTEIEEEIEEEVPADDADGDAFIAGFEGAAGEEIDDDIREVFLEEVAEEIDNLGRQVPVWRQAPDNLDELKSIRRSFHTLKGSGRLVGALTLGEFSWKVENMLNRVLDRTIPASPAVVALIDRALDALPRLHAALSGEAAKGGDIPAIMGTADRIAAGEQVFVPESPKGGTRKVRRTVRRRVRIESVAPAAGSVTATSVLVDREETSAEIAPGPLPNIDPVLFDILQSEVASHLAVIDEYVTRCRVQPVPATDALLRAVHTLNGAIAMVDIPCIGNALAPLESYVKRLRGAGTAPSGEGLDAMEQTSDLTREVMRLLDARDERLPESAQLVARIVALRDSLPDVAGMSIWTGGGESVETGPGTAAPVEAEPRQQAEEGAHAEDLSEGSIDEWLRNAETPAEASPVSIPLPAEAVESLANFDHEAVRDHAAMQTAEDGEGDAEAKVEPGSLAFDHDDGASGEHDLGDIAIDWPADAEPDSPVGTDAGDAGEVGASEASQDHEPPVSTSAAHPDAWIEPPPEAVEDVSEAAASAGHPETSMASEAPVRQADEPGDAIHGEAEPSAATAPKAVLAGSPLPPLAEDTQPDGTLDAPDADDDLLEIFVQEGSDILDHADALVAHLREAPADHAPIAGLQRDLHTLKGGARMAGLTPIGDLSHAMESLIDAIGEGRVAVDRAAVDSLELGFDRLHVMVQRVAQRRAIAMPVHAIERFEALVAARAADSMEPAAPIPPAESLAPEPTHVAEGDAPVSPGADVGATAAKPAPEAHVAPPNRTLRDAAPAETDDGSRAAHELIRVRSDLLDSLVNYAGEVSIYRSRLEQQISTFRFNLVELDQTVARLREQLRKLEIETEAQIIARYQREQHEEGVFDPLELDRFSQLQQLSRALSESVSDLVSIQSLLDDQTRQSETLLLQQSRVSSELQEGLMRTRMVPFDSLVPNLRRTLRQAAQDVGKRAQLKVDGAHGEMDRNLLERMKAPFEHMLRNALAHGIESPAERELRGKPVEGTVNIAVSREATEVVVRVSDDGRGMNREAIRAQAIERGLLKPDVDLPDRDLYAFILETGFTTARELTQLAGRGVGMDVVNNEIKQLGGSLLIDSEPGRGTTFTIRLPFTLAVTQAILVKLGESAYAIPMSSVQGVARIARDDLDRRLAEGDPRHMYAGEEYAIYDLAQLLGLPRMRVATDDTQVPLLMTRAGDQRAAVRIDGVIGSREIVVKSVGPQVSSVPGIFGATIMGDGSVVIILDLAPLVRRLAAMRERVRAGIEAEPVELVAEVENVADVRRKPLVMVVDDSITMRKVTTRVLERVDYEVVTAKDGLDALEKLQDSTPDLMLLDIEMPRMDGYELATYMRNDTRLRRVPIIMITSRTGEKHRQRALEIGVERYLGKPYQEDDLLRNVQEVLTNE